MLLDTVVGKDSNYYVPLSDKELQPHDVEIQSTRQLGSATFWDCCVNLIKSIIGAGMLALPSAFAAFGYLPGTLVLVACAYSAAFGLKIYSLCAMRVGGDAGIRQICSVVDKRLERILDLAILLLCLGSAVSYLILIGDMMVDVASGLFGWNTSRTFWILALGLGIMGPLAFIKNVRSLRYSSLLGLASVGYVLYLAYRTAIAQAPNQPHPNVPLFTSPLQWSASDLNVFIFAFSCHQNLLAIKAEARDKSESFTRSYISWSVGLSTAVYVFFAISSLRAYGTDVEANVFLNYPAAAFQYIAGRGLYALMAVFSYPLLTHPARLAAVNLTRGFIDEITVTVVIVGITILAGLFLTDLKHISGLLGTVAGIPICYILPFYFYWHLFPEDRAGKYWSPRLFVAAALCVSGIALLGVSVFSR